MAIYLFFQEFLYQGQDLYEKKKWYLTSHVLRHAVGLYENNLLQQSPELLCACKEK